MSCTEWGDATLINVPWIETDWDDPPKGPICPKCGNIIDYDETVDESTNDETHEILCVGGCSRCGANYQWWEVYKFSHIEGLEEVK